MRRRVSISLVVLLSTLGACGTEGATGDGPEGAASSEAARPGTTTEWSDGSWEAIGPAPEGTSDRAPPVWTGEELVVWGAPGSAFRPADRTWRVLPPAPIADRLGMAAVWTGEEVVYWGGSATDRDEFFADGAAYDPVGNSWRRIAPSPLSPRSGVVAGMVDGAMLVWGGITQCCPIDSVIHDVRAARYDPATDSWAQLADVPEPWSGDDGPAVTVSTGDGSLYVFRRQLLGRYDPSADAWREVEPPALPDPNCFVTGGPAAVAEVEGSTIFTWSGGCRVEHGRAYDAVMGAWREVAEAPSGIEVWGSSSTSGSGAVFVFATGAFPDEEPLVHAYLTAQDAWVRLPPLPESVGRGAHLVWTGSELLAWGGWQQSQAGQRSEAVRTGALYRRA